MLGFIIHDENGNIQGVVVPSSAPGGRMGVRSHDGHGVSVVELPEIEQPKLAAHVADLIATHRLERATGSSPARLVRKPKKSDEER